MFRNFCAIALFILLIPAVAARAEELSRHFAAADPSAPLPDVLFEDDKGQSLRLSDFRGRAVLLNLWASWCGPCIEEMPSLDRLQAAMGRGVLTVIALNEERNGTEVAISFFRRHGIAHLGVYGDPSGRVDSLLRARGLPTSFLIGADGREIGSVEGSVDWASPDTMAFLRERLLKPALPPDAAGYRPNPGF